MTDDVKEIIRSVRALARRADVAARKLERYRAVSVPNKSTGVTGLSQMAQQARDFHGAIEAAFESLNEDTKKSFA